MAQKRNKAGWKASEPRSFVGGVAAHPGLFCATIHTSTQKIPKLMKISKQRRAAEQQQARALALGKQNLAAVKKQSAYSDKHVY